MPFENAISEYYRPKIVSGWQLRPRLDNPESYTLTSYPAAAQVCLAPGEYYSIAFDCKDRRLLLTRIAAEPDHKVHRQARKHERTITLNFKGTDQFKRAFGKATAFRFVSGSPQSELILEPIN